MATCPKEGVFVWHYKPEQITAMVDAVLEFPVTEEKFEPLIISFLCSWCAYAAADLAGTSGMQYPPNVKIIRVMCSGMVHPNIIVNALTKGVDGVLVCGCHPEECHYVDGNIKAENRAEAIQVMLEDLGLEPERFRLEWIGATEPEKFVQVAKDMTENLRELGPSPYRG
jgi:F420-non-reducing hydrogenase iron-sulfur subunit